MANVIDELIRREGGYVNNPNDKGGPTKYGITIATLGEYRGAPVTAEDVAALTEQEARKIYETKYAGPFSAYSGYPQLYDLLVDSAVQHGVARVQGWLKLITPTTSDPNPIYKFVLQSRLKFYGAIITATPTNAVFAKGWMIRLSEFVR